ncbi:MAG TPA: toxin [Streptomyces sp.]|uniref:toxin n=1 Tax=Streptomyces sp. TaxID=1931 RepID=UPI002D75B2BF|nr:toxin [Streptomyces sp.]HZG06325.1 toxin [Streptomyces sp.]
MQRACERLITEAGITSGSDITAICDQVSRRRGRPIRLTPMELGEPLLHGLWIALADTDVIVYRADTSRSHQEHIIAHELSHIICGHDFGGIPGPATPTHLFPDLAPNLVRRALQRSAYADRDEQEAEMMASLILARARRGAIEPPPALPPEIATVMARVESVIGRG